jgi:hypothetical protein
VFHIYDVTHAAYLWLWDRGGPPGLPEDRVTE